jgi:hypothetical protein
MRMSINVFDAIRLLTLCSLRIDSFEFDLTAAHDQLALYLGSQVDILRCILRGAAN